MMTTVATLDEPVKPDDGITHDFEHIGSILRRLPLFCDARMTPDSLSHLIDDLVQHEEDRA